MAGASCFAIKFVTACYDLVSSAHIPCNTYWGKMLQAFAGLLQVLMIDAAALYVPLVYGFEPVFTSGSNTQLTSTADVWQAAVSPQSSVVVASYKGEM